MHSKVNEIRRFLMRLMTSKIGHSISGKDITLLKNTPVTHVLIVRPNSRLGNQLLLTPLLQEIIHYFPLCKIDIFVRGSLAPVLFKNYPNIERFIRLPSKPFKQPFNYIKTWFSLRKYKYDLVLNVDIQSSSGRIATNITKSKIKFYNYDHTELLLLNPDYKHLGKCAVYNFRYFLHKADYTLNDQPIPPLSLHLSCSELNNGALKLREITQSVKPTICIYTFATGDKCYPKEWWKETYAQLKNTYENRFYILEILPKENISQIDFSAPSYYSTDIREMSAVIANSSIFISSDCGIMHLASSVKVPTVGLFSITDKNCYAPYNTGSIAVDTTQTCITELMERIDKILSSPTS